MVPGVTPSAVIVHGHATAGANAIERLSTSRSPTRTAMGVLDKSGSILRGQDSMGPAERLRTRKSRRSVTRLY